MIPTQLLLLASLVPVFIFIVEQGLLRCPLPEPAAGFFVEPLPPSFPPVPKSLKDFDVDDTSLAQATRLFEGKVVGSESVAVSKEGVLYMADEFGKLWRATPSSSGSGSEYTLDSEPFARLGAGRALGMQIDHDGSLLVCDPLKGLLRMNLTTGQLEILATHVNEGPLEFGADLYFTNDLDVAANGTVFFSTSTTFVPSRNSQGFWDVGQAYLTAVFGGHHGGKLLAYDPVRRTTRALLGGLWFANGVALAADESFVLVVDTQWVRIHRYWLTGPKAGTSEVAVDRLPAFPDGIERASDGGFWVTLVAPMLPVYPLLRSKALRALTAWLPPALRPKPDAVGMMLKLTPDLQPEKLYLEPTGKHVSFVSGCEEHQGKLFLGNLVGPYVSVMQL